MHPQKRRGMLAGPSYLGCWSLVHLGVTARTAGFINAGPSSGR